MELISCYSFLSKLRGLMFRFSKKDLVFINKVPKRINLHTLFVFYSIDILFLDENKRIIKYYKCVKPFTFYIPGIKSKYILELVNNSSLDYKIGEKINF